MPRRYHRVKKHLRALNAVEKMVPHVRSGFRLMHKARRGKRSLVGFQGSMLKNFRRVKKHLLPHASHPLVGGMLRKVVLPALKLNRKKGSHIRGLIKHHRTLHSIAHRARKMRGGNKFTDFFKGVGNKIKDAFTKPVKLPDWAKKTLNGLRDFVNPAIVMGAKALSHVPIPLLSKAAEAISTVGDNYLKLMPPQAGPLKVLGGRRRHRRHTR